MEKSRQPNLRSPRGSIPGGESKRPAAGSGPGVRRTTFAIQALARLATFASQALARLATFPRQALALAARIFSDSSRFGP